MERVRNDESLAADAFAGEGRAHLIHRRDRAGDDGLRRRVHGGDGDAARVSAIAAATSCSDAAMAAMAPPGGRVAISAPRLAIRRIPSSRLKTPATVAATISPTEWPATMFGVTPNERHSLGQRIFHREQRGLRVAGIVEVGAASPSPNTTS